MKARYLLTPSQPTQHVQLAWSNVAGVAIMNNAPYSCLLRDGAQEIPTSTRYDYLVPPGQYITLPVIAHDFGLALDVQFPGALTYFQPCTVVFFSGDEPVMPDFGAGGYRENVHLSRTLAIGESVVYALDARASRALFMSSRVDPNVWNWFPVYADIFTSPVPTDQPEIDGKLIRHVSLTRIAAAHETVIPLAANYLYLRFVNPPLATDPVLIDVDLSLLDAVPPTPVVDPWAVASKKDMIHEQTLPITPWSVVFSTSVPEGSRWMIRQATVRHIITATLYQNEIGIAVDRGRGEIFIAHSLQTQTASTVIPYYVVSPPLSVELFPGDYLRFYARAAVAGRSFWWGTVIDELDL